MRDAAAGIQLQAATEGCAQIGGKGRGDFGFYLFLVDGERFGQTAAGETVEYGGGEGIHVGGGREAVYAAVLFGRSVAFGEAAGVDG